MMHVLNETINYTRQRNLFGSTVLDQQVVHFTLAELKTEIEANGYPLNYLKILDEVKVELVDTKPKKKPKEPLQ